MRGKQEERRQRTRGNGPQWALKSGGRVERTRGGGIDATTSWRTSDFHSGGESNGNGIGNGDGDGKCHAPPSCRDLAATALVLTAEAASTLIADVTDGDNSGVTIAGRASLVAGGGLFFNSIVLLLSTL